MAKNSKAKSRNIKEIKKARNKKGTLANKETTNAEFSQTQVKSEKPAVTRIDFENIKEVSKSIIFMIICFGIVLVMYRFGINYSQAIEAYNFAVNKITSGFGLL